MTGGFISWLPFIGFTVGLAMLYAIWRETRKTKGIEVYSNRLEAPGWQETFSSCQALWCLFQTGAVSTELDFYDRNQVRQLILIDPLGNYINTHGYQRDVENLKRNILELARRLRENKRNSLQLFFFDGAISTSMIIGNPESTTDGVIQIEISYPYSKTDHRPIWIIRQSKNPKLFAHFKEEYLSIINHSKQYDDQKLWADICKP